MPPKRRIGKARHLDDYKRQQLLEGPDACLLAGVGYLAPFRASTFDGLEPEEQAALLDAMREDWGLWGCGMLERWRRGEVEPAMRPWVFVVGGGPEQPPWAEERFGEPWRSDPATGT